MMFRTTIVHPVRWSLLFLVVVLAALGGLLGCEPASSDRSAPGTASVPVAQAKSDDPAAQTDAIPITVAAVSRQPLAAYLQGTSTVESPAQVQVLAKAAGLAARVVVEEGQQVERGQLLTQLEDDEARLALDRARIELSEAELAYTSLVHLDQKEAQLELQRARLTAQEALENYRRILAMERRGLASQRDVEVAQTQKSIADVAVQQAQNRLQYKTIDDARFRHERAKTALQEAELQLSYTTITAPISGVISARLVVPGQFVTANQPIVTIVDTTRLIARTFLPEKMSAQVQVGQAARVAVEALPNEPFPARVELISPVIDAESGTFKVTVEILKPQPALKPGMFVTVFIRVAERQNALVIPKRALTFDRSKPTVYRLRDGRAYQVPVTLGLVDGDQVEVLSGLTEGNQVVVLGQEKLLDGSAVRVVPRGSLAQRPVRRE